MDKDLGLGLPLNPNNPGTDNGGGSTIKPTVPNNTTNYTGATRFYRSFSGTDALVFVMLPQTEPILLGALTTISYSMYRDKKPVPVVGQINVGGFTRGTRIYAGTMIFTMINQHWVNELRDQVKWLKNLKVSKVDELPLFDLMIVCANEYGAAMQMFIYGVDLTEEGQVLSVEDIFTENTFSFVARDITNFSNEFMTNEGVVKVQPSVKQNKFSISSRSLQRSDLSSTLQYDTSSLVTGTDVAKIQQMLNQRLGKARALLPVTSIYDSDTFNAVKAFQSMCGLPITGLLDDETYTYLSDDEKELTYNSALVSSITGASVRQMPDFESREVYKLPYLEQFTFDEKFDNWIKIKRGYVHISEIEYYGEDYSKIFSPILPYETKPIIGIIQEQLFNNTSFDVDTTGIWDDATMEAIKSLQQTYHLQQTGILDEATFHALTDYQIITISENELFHNHSKQKLRDTPNRYTTTPPVQRPSSLFYVSQYDSKPGVYMIKRSMTSSPGFGLDTFYPKDSLKRFGMTIHAQGSDINVHSYICSTYPNGNSKYFDYSLVVPKNTSQAITLDQFLDSILYDIENESEPKSVEYLIRIENEDTLKWIINFESEE